LLELPFISTLIVILLFALAFELTFNMALFIVAPVGIAPISNVNVKVLLE
jgi:hypothetical protein